MDKFPIHWAFQRCFCSHFSLYHLSVFLSLRVSTRRKSGASGLPESEAVLPSEVLAPGSSPLLPHFPSLSSVSVRLFLSSSSPLRWSSLLESGIPLAHARMTTRFVLWLPDRCTPTARCERGPYPVFQEIPPAARVQEREVLSIGDALWKCSRLLGFFDLDLISQASEQLLSNAGNWCVVVVFW